MARFGLLNEVPGGISPQTQQAVRELNATALDFLHTQSSTPDQDSTTASSPVPYAFGGIRRPGGRKNPGDSGPLYPY